jgi:hypothetical protein
LFDTPAPPYSSFGAAHVAPKRAGGSTTARCRHDGGLERQRARERAPSPEQREGALGFLDEWVGKQRQAAPPGPRVGSAAEAPCLLGISLQTLYKRVQRGQIKGRAILYSGRRVQFRLDLLI